MDSRRPRYFPILRIFPLAETIYTAAVSVNNYLPGGRVNKKIFARQRGRVNKKLFARQKKLLARQSISMVAMTQIEVYG